MEIGIVGDVRVVGRSRPVGVVLRSLVSGIDGIVTNTVNVGIVRHTAIDPRGYRFGLQFGG